MPHRSRSKNADSPDARLADMREQTSRTEDIEHLATHLIETQAADAVAVAEGIAASAQASGNAAQQSLWLRVRDEIARRACTPSATE